MLQAFLAYILKNKLLPQKGTTLLAVSGGVDSVVMSALFHQAQLDFAIAHCNFGLRGTASDDDATWVRTLAKQYAVACYAHTLDVRAYAHKHSVSLQMAARTLRYTWFQQLCLQYGFKKVATAHHLNDNLETVILHLTRGTGIAGLHGIPAQQDRYIRPLLFATKKEISKYAQEAGLIWREDSSNRYDNYQRNLVRNQVVPQLRKLNPRLEVTFKCTLTRMVQTEAVFNEHVERIQKKIGHYEGSFYYIAIHTIKDQIWAPVVAWELLKAFGFNFAQINQLLTQKNTKNGAMMETGSHQLYVDRGHWIVIPRVTHNTTTYMLPRTTRSLKVPPYTLACTHISYTQYTIGASRQVAALDSTQLHFPLTIRKWQPGDVFYPLGMQKKKKISDFLIDTKVPIPLKAQTWVVTSDDKIVWVMGHRIDERFKIIATTQQVYEMRLNAPLKQAAQKPLK